MQNSIFQTTPSNHDGSSDMSFEKGMDEITPVLQPNSIVINKSTVPLEQ